MKRREFLGTSLAALTATQAPSWAWGLETKKRSEPAKLPSEDRSEPAKWIAVSRSNRLLAGASVDGAGTAMPSTLEIYDSALRLLFTVPLPFNAHAWAQNGKSPHLLYGTSKWGNEGGIVDLKARKYVGPLERGARKRFFGHGLALADGRMLLSMRDDETKRAELVFYQDAKPVESIALSGSYAHELRFAPQDPNLVLVAVGNREKKGTLTWVDLKKKAIARDLASGFYFPAHFRFLGDDDKRILLLGTAKKPAVEIIENGETTYLEPSGPFVLEKGMRPESLNAAFDPKNPEHAWVAVYGGNTFLKVDCRAKKILEVMPMAGSRHAFRNSGELYISNVSEREMSRGAHLLRWGKGWETVTAPAEFGNSSHVDFILPVA